MPVCECECVNECDFRLKVVCCWGLFWPGMVRGRKRASAPLLSIILVIPLKYPRVLKLIRGCIGSSGNVRVGGLAIGLSWWNMGKLVFPGGWRLYVKSIQLSMCSFKASCLGYPNHIHTSEHKSFCYFDGWMNFAIDWIFHTKSPLKFRKF